MGGNTRVQKTIFEYFDKNPKIAENFFSIVNQTFENLVSRVYIKKKEIRKKNESENLDVRSFEFQKYKLSISDPSARGSGNKDDVTLVNLVH
jgi:hypothetical protein